MPPVFQNLTPNGRGMLAITGASSIFVFSDALAKLSSKYWSVAQFLTIRGIFAILLAAFVVFARGEGGKIGLVRRPLVVVRSCLEAVIAVSFISALSMMPLADLTAILMLSPLVITAIATLVFGELVGWRRWSAIFAGFIGMVLVVQPGGAASSAPNYLFAASLGLFAVVAVALRDIVTRRLGDDIPSVVVTLGTAVGSFSSGVLLSTVEPWHPFSWQPLALCVLTALLLTMGNFLLIVGCRGVDLSVVAPYRYSGVLWAILVGYLAFGDVPNALSITGMGIIVASGIYTMHRERVRRRQAQG